MLRGKPKAQLGFMLIQTQVERMRIAYNFTLNIATVNENESEYPNVSISTIARVALEITVNKHSNSLYIS